MMFSIWSPRQPRACHPCQCIEYWCYHDDDCTSLNTITLNWLSLVQREDIMVLLPPGNISGLGYVVKASQNSAEDPRNVWLEIRSRKLLDLVLFEAYINQQVPQQIFHLLPRRFKVGSSRNLEKNTVDTRHHTRENPLVELETIFNKGHTKQLSKNCQREIMQRYLESFMNQNLNRNITSN